VLSIDGVSQQVYQQFRRKGDAALVYQNVRKLVAARTRLGRSTPIIVWRYLMFEHNTHEIPAAIEKARELGVDQFRADPAWDASWDDPAIRPASDPPICVNFRQDFRTPLLENWNRFPEQLDSTAIESEYERRWTDNLPETQQHPIGHGSTCEWLYKSITLDAGARIFPCCCAPRPNADLIFAHLHGESDDADLFNSEKHRISRLFFANPEGYRVAKAPMGLDKDTYCVRCEWDKMADPSPGQIRQYLLAAAPGLFDEKSLNFLSLW